VQQISEEFEQTPIDRTDIAQGELDLKNRARTNPFPWRGQFSPGLVEVLLKRYAIPGVSVFDPFAGVGTTLFEAARQACSSGGTEINPAAHAMADTVVFLPLSTDERRIALERAATLLTKAMGSAFPLFAYGDTSERPAQEILVELLSDGSIPRPERNLLTNTLIRAIEFSVPITFESVFRAFSQHAQIVLSLPISKHEHYIQNADARKIPLAAEHIDLVITSPPYINVFNYHQNNRPAMELLGWDLLHVAKSEFGSNRKHRGNRFLTVIQYCLDMHSALIELRRTIKCSGRVIIVVGRESNVRGVAFQNGSLVSSLAKTAGFKLGMRQERKFRNKFGENIYEDILHLVPTSSDMTIAPSDIALHHLKRGLAQCQRAEVKSDLYAAMKAVAQVKPSPMYVPVSTAKLMVA